MNIRISVRAVLLAIALLIPMVLPAQEQFAPTNGPYGASPSHILVTADGAVIIASGRHNRLLRSTDHGSSWTVLRNGLPAGSATSLYQAPDGAIYAYILPAVVSPSALYRSTDGGDSWTNLGTPADQYENIRKLAGDVAGNLYAVTTGNDGGIFRSTDGGGTWSRVVADPSLDPASSVAVAADGSLLVAKGNIYRSTDHGSTWSPVLSNPPVGATDVLPVPGGDVWGVAADYNGIRTRVYHSSDKGATWSAMPTDFHGGYGNAAVTSDGALLIHPEFNTARLIRIGRQGSGWKIDTLAPDFSHGAVEVAPIACGADGRIYAAFNDILFRSDDAGGRWQLTGATTGDSRRVAADDQGNVYVALSDGGMARTTDGGATWFAANEGMRGNRNVTSIAIDSRGNVFAGTDFAQGRIDGSGLYRSTDHGRTWNVAGPDGAKNIMALHATANDELIIAADKRLYRSDDGGGSWTEIALPQGMVAFFHILGFREENGAIFMVTGHLQNIDESYVDISRSTDGGTTWQVVRTMPGLARSFVICPNSDLLLTFNDSMIRSTDAGVTWNEEPTKPGSPDFFDGVRLLGVSPTGQIWMFTAYGKLQISYDNGRNWQPVASMNYMTDLAFTNSGDIYTATGDVVYRGRSTGAWSRTNIAVGKSILSLAAADDDEVQTGSLSYGFMVSRNNGDTWLNRSFGLPQFVSSILPESDDHVLVGTNAGVFRTTDGGTSWKQISPEITPTIFIYALVKSSSGALYAGTFGEGIYWSTNGGASWSARSSGLGNLFVKGMSVAPDGMLYTATNGGVFRSGDDGASWSAASGGFSATFFANAVVAMQGGAVVIGTKGGIYRSTDGGGSWAHVSPVITEAAEVRALYLDEAGSIWAGSDAGAFASHDGGITWEAAGLGDNDVRAFTENSRYIFAGTQSNGVYRMAKKAASIDRPSAEMRGAANLTAVPNPASGPVSIRFSLPEEGPVTLAMFNALGEEVARLADGPLAAGEHILYWEGDVPSGAYYCVLSCGSGRTVLSVIRTFGR